jgi:hypothetical protein
MLLTLATIKGVVYESNGLGGEILTGDCSPQLKRAGTWRFPV